MNKIELQNIEFYGTPTGKVMISCENGLKIYEMEDRDFTEAMVEKIQNFYPMAFKALTELYLSSKPNRSYYEYLIVHRFIRCNYNEYDNKKDIDSEGTFNFEFVQCPLRGECKLCGVVCNPSFNTKLSERETEVMRLYFRSYSAEKIADMLFISIQTVIKHKRNSLQKLNLHSLSEFISLASRNKMFDNDNE